MKLYCMCQITGDVPPQARDTQGFGPLDNQVFLAPNRFCKLDKETKDLEYRPVILRRSMVCLKNGIHQYVTDNPIPNIWIRTPEEHKEDTKKLQDSRRHYPDIDLYICPVCGAMICVEG